MKEELEKNKKELSLSTAINSKLALNRVEKFVSSPRHLLERYNPDCWIKAYENQYTMFKEETSPILKDIAIAYGEEVVVDLIMNHILKVARINFIKLSIGENDVRNIAELIYSKMKDCNCGELMLFFEKYQRKELIDTIRCLSYSEINDAIITFLRYRQDKLYEIKKSREPKNIVIYRIASIMNSYENRQKYGEVYIENIWTVAEVLINSSAKHDIDLSGKTNEWILSCCRNIWSNIIK